MATLPDVPVPSDTWVNLNTESGLAEGTPLTIQNKSPTNIYLYEGAVAPDDDSTDGILINSTHNSRGSAEVTAGSEAVWARCSTVGKTSKVCVQAL